MRVALGAAFVLLAGPWMTAACASMTSARAPGSTTSVAASSPGGPLSRSDNTPFASSPYILGARWSSGRYDPPANQSGDILPTVWSDDGGTYVMMDNGGVDVPVRGALWRNRWPG